MNKYCVIFHLVTGRDVRTILTSDADIEDEMTRNSFVNTLIEKRFGYFFENGRLTILNTDNVASITVTKAEEEAME